MSTTKRKWPKSMPVWTATDMTYGCWATNPMLYAGDTLDNGLYIDQVPASCVPECNTRFCFVGHVRHAFGLPASPDSGGPLPPQGVKFLRRALAELGVPDCDPDGCCSLEYYASGVYESQLDDPRIDQQAAADALNAAARHFGYTEIVEELVK